MRWTVPSENIMYPSSTPMPCFVRVIACCPKFHSCTLTFGQPCGVGPLPVPMNRLAAPPPPPPPPLPLPPHPPPPPPPPPPPLPLPPYPPPPGQSITRRHHRVSQVTVGSYS